MINRQSEIPSSINHGPVRLVLENVSVTPEEWQQDNPDEHWAAYKGNEQVGHCSIWWRDVPAFRQHRLGLVGHFAATDSRVARRLLENAEERMAIRGCDFIVGPMNGSTWRTYRAVTWRGDRPGFFLEPDIEESTADYFIENGYWTIGNYYSCETDVSDRDSKALDQLTSGFARQGVSLRTLDLQDLDNELSRIHEVCDESFSDSFLYTTLDRQAFKVLYQPIKRWATPELILLAEKGGRTIGFLFAVPDLAQVQRGEQVDTVIFKTLAVRPEYFGRKLGYWLIEQGYKAARSRGCCRVIHAFMHADNVSLRISHKHYQAKTIREYALFGKEIGHEPV